MEWTLHRLFKTWTQKVSRVLPTWYMQDFTVLSCLELDMESLIWLVWVAFSTVLSSKYQTVHNCYTWLGDKIYILLTVDTIKSNVTFVHILKNSTKIVAHPQVFQLILRGKWRLRKKEGEGKQNEKENRK